MAKRKLADKLIDKSEIQEEMRLIKGSLTDYITPSGEIYKDYGNDKFYHKAQFIIQGYWYTTITYPWGQVQRRVHILVAEAYIPNPNNYPIVMHIDGDKSNKNYTNLKWGTLSENSKDAFANGLAVNAKGWDDNQSTPVCQFDLNENLLEKYGSIGEAERETGITEGGIIYQCKHLVKTHPRCGYYFRYLSEYEEYGFVL